MIASFGLENFKSYKTATLPLAPLTLLIGANASGKSNAIEAIRLLSWLARGRRLSEILQTVQAEDVAVRGRLSDLTYNGATTFTLGCSVQEPGVDEWNTLSLEVGIDTSGLRIRNESITSASSRFPLYRVEPSSDPYSHELQVSYNNFSRGGKKPHIAASNQQAVFTQLTTPARFENARAQRVIPDVTKIYQTRLEQILFLDPNPRSMRDYSFVVDSQLQGDGANLSSVLYELVHRHHRRDEVLAFIQSLPEQQISDISFLEGPRNEVMVQLTETFGNRMSPREAPLLSDGTLRVLAVAAALLSASNGSLVVIEEIDNGVHPSRASMLLENIQRIAREMELSVLLTTHNPALLDALPLDAVPDVVCCYRDPSEGDSRLMRLEELPNYPELIAQGPLGSLVTRGVLDRFLKTRRSVEEERQAELAWLADLEAQLAKR